MGVRAAFPGLKPGLPEGWGRGVLGIKKEKITVLVTFWDGAKGKKRLLNGSTPL